MNSVNTKIARNSFIQIIGKAVSIAISLATIGIITRYLGQTGFGQYAIILAFLQIFGILADFGLQMTTVQLISDPNYSEEKILGNILGLRLVSAIIFLGLAPAVALFFPYAAEVKIGITLASLAFVATALITILTGVFQKHLSMTKVVMAEIISRLIFLIGLVYVVSQDFSLLGVIGALILSALTQFLLLFRSASKIIPIKWQFDTQIWRTIIKKTWPIAVTIALNLIYFKADTIILSLFRDTAEVGLYAAPYKVLEVLINIAYLYLGLILPLMVLHWSQKNLDEIKKILQTGFDVLTMFSLPLIGGVLVLGGRIMTLVAGENFTGSGNILKVLIVATVAIFYAGLFGYMVVAADKQRQMIKYYIINAIGSLVLYFIFIPLYGYWAAAIITILSEAFILVTAYLISYKATKFLPNLKNSYKPLLAALIMSGVIYYLNSLNIFILVLLGAIIYFGVLLLTKGIKKESLQELLKRT
ncbi:MAG: hypothetical protein COT81_05435 [Candidatus Buchananbacteria bacterium CG10_big_fil_rev_8_21_14_0_10_42_9]|uniref:Uncharacterized protein n=1 Tax=Candidatus Buchananbacteria bacterium CG10_big_fil_rev_8_21_14_0_10_42_9 TaxID=1974526 RepID=A0A2H0VZX5_9BACT|nr:MAG: hypothetical protein COT81_05435 [Candidatus Buchananbacteria bacterium CG10_big_fil_rev_8_21_14_0_10_42_9]